MIVLSGFDGAEPPATASFVWPEGERCFIPRAMVLMTPETFDKLTKSTATVLSLADRANTQIAGASMPPTIMKGIQKN